MSSPKQTFNEAISREHSKVFTVGEMAEENKVSVILKSGEAAKAAQILRDVYGFNIPIACGGVDYLSENKIQLIYYLMHPKSKLVLLFRIDLVRADPKIPSLTRVWEAMSFHEREANEMFGIKFEGHPNMVPLLLSPDWKGGYPLRKDFKGEGVQ